MINFQSIINKDSKDMKSQYRVLILDLKKVCKICEEVKIII